MKINNLERMLAEYRELLAFYKEEIAGLPDINLHYKKIKGKYFPYISKMVCGKQKQESLMRKNAGGIELEEKLKYRAALRVAINILHGNIRCLDAIINGTSKPKGVVFVPFSYMEVDRRLTQGFCEGGWSFARYMMGGATGNLAMYEKNAGGVNEARAFDGLFSKVKADALGLEICDAEKWLSVSNLPEYKKAVLMRDEDKLRFDTGRGFRVRSKSEVLISTLVGRAGLLFKYEEPIELIVHSETKRLYEKFCRNVEAGGRKIVLPDFTILAPDGKLWLWEHQGMMDDPQYREKYFFRHDIYARNGFTVGQNLIFTFESEDEPISVEQIERVIKYILAS